jgi:hypothetical protein
VAAKVNLDAMIPRADFAAEEDEYVLDLFTAFQINNLEPGSPILSLLRKPDFQRETAHWTAAQVVSLIASFVDNELIPSLILWKSPKFIFVIDGGHRLSALRAWIEDDFGDGPVTQKFYGNEISAEQKRIAKRTRVLVEQKVGRYTKIKSLVGSPSAGTETERSRANKLVTRALSLQWVQGNAQVAETSFFKINSQGTPLDAVEELLLRNRRKPIPIAARAIVRAGSGTKYWSAFTPENQSLVEQAAREFYDLLFDPEVKQPIKTLDLPIGGSASPLDAMSLLMEMLLISDNPADRSVAVGSYVDDPDGAETLRVLKNAFNVARRFTGNRSGSLGLHPAIYFYNERGGHSRFLFLGMTLLIADRLHNNDKAFFSKFTRARARMESFLVANKSLIGIMLQNMGKNSRVSRMRDMFSTLVERFSIDDSLTVEELVKTLGGTGRILDITTGGSGVAFTDEAKSAIFIKQAIASSPKCSICSGLLYSLKSGSYDHKTPKRDGGDGNPDNGEIVHPYCNDAVKQ